MSSPKQLGELCGKFASLIECRPRAASLHRIIVICAASSMLLGITATTGKAAEVTSLASQSAALDALTYEAVSQSVLWSFAGSSDDGENPEAGLLADKWGNFYGTTWFGGAEIGPSCYVGSLGCGTVFEISPPAAGQTQWSERVLWSFGSLGDGAVPSASLIADRSGNLFGTTSEGGECIAQAGCGTVFELSPPAAGQTQWSESVLWSFSLADGSDPLASLIMDKRGNLYGTTAGGGTIGFGTVFELSPPTAQQTQWNERVLWSFGVASDDGQQPQAGLIADKWGNLYGTTVGGGANANGVGCASSGCGTVFELSPPTGQQTQWSERVLWSFGASGDGAFPAASLLLAEQGGSLYGTTAVGGANVNPDTCAGDGCGTVFELSPPTGQQTQWTERVLWSFGGDDDGTLPKASLIADKLGNLYGPTGAGGANDDGTVFELRPPYLEYGAWTERVLWSFDNDDGNYPAGSLIFDITGNLYGTTAVGGANNDGTAFKLSLARSEH